MLGLATKKDLELLRTKKEAETMEKRIISKIDQAQEELAVITRNGFDNVFERLDAKPRVEKLEKDLGNIKLLCI